MESTHSSEVTNRRRDEEKVRASLLQEESRFLVGCAQEFVRYLDSNGGANKDFKQRDTTEGLVFW